MSLSLKFENKVEFVRKKRIHAEKQCDIHIIFEDRLLKFVLYATTTIMIRVAKKRSLPVRPTDSLSSDISNANFTV